MISAKTQAQEHVIVGMSAHTVETLDFTVDGVVYFWEPTSTGGSADPIVVTEGAAYTVSGKIKPLHDYWKLIDFVFTATCPP